MIHAAIQEAAVQEGLPQFDRAFVQIEVTTPRGSNNHQLWDTCNRAVNLVTNNLKGIFFWDDDLEHMAFSVVGAWAKQVAQSFGSPAFCRLDPSAGSKIPSRTSAPPRTGVCVRIDAEAHSGAAIVLQELPLLLHILT